jgi:heat shock protein 4
VAQQFKDWAASKDEKYAHIGADDRKKVADASEAALKWLDAELAQQAAVPIADTPVLTCDMMTKKKAALEALANPIMNRPKPEPPKPEPKKEEAKPAAAAAGSDGKEAPKADAKPADAGAKPAAGGAGPDAKPAAAGDAKDGKKA